MQKIVLIEPQSKEDHVYKHVRMPRLGLPLLGTQLQEAGYEVNFYLGTGDSLPWSNIFKADLVGISTTTATCREGYQIAGLLRANNIPVVIGGIHASFMPDEAVQFADYIVRGEAEYSFLPLVRSIEAGELPQDIPGVSYWVDGEPVHNPPEQFKVDMDTIPIPDLTLMEKSSSMRTIPVMTSRGCPYNCTFCCVTQMFGRRYRYRCTESILEELAQYEGKHIFFCDDNFVADPKHSRELLREMIDRNINLKGFGAQVRADAAFDDELMELMTRAGCSIVYIGFESINPETLKGYNKHQSVDDIKESIRRFHEYGIRIHGMFVFGGDADTADTIRETADFALEAKIDSIQFMMLTPMPGTPLYEQLESEGRIITYDWSLYEGQHAVFKPVMISPEDLQNETVKALKKFYSLTNIFDNVTTTGWASALHRAIGWGLTRHFAYQNRWFVQFLKNQQYANPQPVTLFEHLLQVPDKADRTSQTTTSPLKVSLTEQQGVLYLKLKGFAGSLHLRELKRTLKKLPRHCSQMVVNTEGLRFVSEKTAAGFAAYLEKLGSRVRRLQVITAAEKQARIFLNWKRKSRIKLPRFEVRVYKH